MRIAPGYIARRVRNLAILEFLNIPFIAVVVTVALGMPLTVANLTGLALTLFVLLEGGSYWWLKLRQLKAGSPVPAGLGLFRVLSTVNVVLLTGGIVCLGVSFAVAGAGTSVWPGLALWVVATLEHVNYFYVQLMHDTRADLSRLVTTGRPRRSHLARDLARQRLQRTHSR